MQLNWETIRWWGWRSLQAAIFVVVVAAGLYWYFAAVPVIEHQIEAGKLVAEVMGTGTLEARVKSTMSPKIAGRVHEIFVDQGDHVKAGQTLFTLDDAELQQQVEIAEATLAFWKASLDRLLADHDQANAVLEGAKKDYERIQPLVATNTITLDEGEKSTERLRIAEAGVSRSVAAQVEGRKQITTAERSLAYSDPSDRAVRWTHRKTLPRSGRHRRAWEPHLDACLHARDLG